MAHKAEFLVDVNWLRERRGDPGVILVDTRGPADFWSGHLASARHFDPFPFHYYDTGERGTAEFRAQLEWIFSALGITRDATVVFYEDDSGMRAARCAWALEWMGYRAARILDGGLRALDGERLTAEVAPFAPARFEGAARSEIAASLGYITERLGRKSVQIFDVRSDAEYYSERIRAKHGGAIPGAIHRDWATAQNPTGAFRSPKELRASFLALGLEPDAEIITYCQGGYRAAHTYFALKMAGFGNVRNYWGSWAEWGNRDDVPIERPRRPNGG